MDSDKKVLIINGPNINLLGIREPDIYGNLRYKELENLLKKEGEKLGLCVICFQSNSESAIIERIHKAKEEKVDFIIINAAAFTHTSIAIRDALAGVAIRFIEVHISNIFKRENFRHKSYLSGIAEGVIAGFGINGYLFALKQVSLLLNI